MTKINKNEVAILPDAAALEALKNSFPAEVGFDRILLPRIDFKSQDVLEGTGKDKKCVIEAGTFFTSFETDAVDVEGKKVWKTDEIGKTLEATIIFSRKQLKYWDSKMEIFTSSPVYDNDDEIVPLFCSGNKIMEGLPEDLKKKYEYKDEDGKTKSKLEETRVLYVLYKGEVYQLNLRGSSMWSFKTYSKKTTLIPAQLTKFFSESKVKGLIMWNCMNFEKIRDLNADEVKDIQNRVNEIRGAIDAEKAYYKKDREDAKLPPVAYPTEDSSQCLL